MERQSLADGTVSLIRSRSERNERRICARAADVDLFNCALLVRHWVTDPTCQAAAVRGAQSVLMRSMRLPRLSGQNGAEDVGITVLMHLHQRLAATARQ